MEQVYKISGERLTRSLVWASWYPLLQRYVPALTPVKEGFGPGIVILDFEEIGVDLDIVFPLFGSCRLFKNRCNGTGRFTRATVNTLIGVNIEHLSRIEPLFALRRMDAVYRTYIYARCILHANAWLSNYISHCLSILLLARLA
jgi:hypothetical protein